MGLFNRLTAAAESPATTEPKRPNRFDPFLRDRELGAAFRALMEGDWAELGHFMDSSRKAWMFSHAITSPIVDLEHINLERWIDADNSPHARILRAGLLLRDAFETQPSDPSPSLADADWVEPADGMAPFPNLLDGELEEPGSRGRFEHLIEEAEDLLREVITERPAMPEPWVYMLISGRGRGVPLEEMRQRFDNAHSRDPFRPDACREYLQSLTEKWGGSQTAVFDFARWIEVEAAPDSPAREALPMAHIEQGLVDPSGALLQDYLAGTDVLDELTTALLNVLNALPFRASTESLGVLNVYAMAMTVTTPRTARLVEDVFDRIDDRPTAQPWQLYREGVATAFHQVKAEQLRRAARLPDF